MKINLNFIKWWHILIFIGLFLLIVYLFNIDKEPYKFIGINDKGLPDEIFLKPKYNNFLAKTVNSRYKCEELCRQTLENIYGVKFKKIRPDWLCNPETGKNMELDGYNDSVKIGFEYNGEQHYTFPNRWHKYKWEFDKQVERDRLKDKLCTQHHIFLIKIPYTISINNIPKYIDDQLKIYNSKRKF